MCLAIPAQVKSIEGHEGNVEVGGISRKASFMLTPEVMVGDYVLLHTGYAISIVDETEAKETLKLLEELARQGAVYS
jgi:hydrogenase expression/formation protein HypC